MPDNYDLTTHLSAWHTPNLREVGLTQLSERLTQFARLVDGAERLRIFFKNGGEGDLHISAETEHRTFAAALMYWDDTRLRDIAETMISAGDALRAVKQFSLPLDMLLAFLPLIATLPALVCLGVCIVLAPAGGAAHHLPRDTLPGMTHIADVCPVLDELVLHVVCSRRACLPTTGDAQQLVDWIMSLREGGTLPREISLKGFLRGSYDIVQYGREDVSSIGFTFI